MDRTQARDKVVVTGMAGIFPNSKNVEQFYRNINEKKQLLASPNPDWKFLAPGLPPLIGRQPLEGGFDAGFFGVHHKHADEMHPSCRKLLELSVEAVIDSGMSPLDVKGSNTGVFVASSDIETKNEWVLRRLSSPNFSVFGSSDSLLAARISYHLQLQGPTVTIDTACSSSMHLLDDAVKAILSGRCDSALVCGLNSARNPNVSYGYQQLNVLNPDGDGNVFDESCTGYVKSEGTAVVFLQKAKDAKRVYAEILNVKTNSDGFKQEGITHSSFEMMAEVFQDVYDEIGVDPSVVRFVECHITGTNVGIVEEIKAVEKVFCSGRKTPLPIGSLKANVGHSEPLSGLASLIKILLGLQHNCILPNPDYKNLKTCVRAFQRGTVAVATEHIPLPTDQDVIIGCNNSGFGGTNGHLVLKHLCEKQSDSRRRRPSRLVCFSARTMSSLRKISDSLDDNPTEEYLALLQNVFRRNLDNHRFRGYAITNNGRISEKSLEVCGEKARLCLVYPRGTRKWLSLSDNVKNTPSTTRIRNGLLLEGIDVFKLWERKGALEQGDLVLATVALQLAITDVLRELIQDRIDLVECVSCGAIAAAYAKGVLPLDEALLLASKLKNTADSTLILNELKSLDHRTFSGHHIKVVVGPGPVGGPFNFDPSTTLVQMLGRLYTSGFDLHLEKLYPDVSWPVKAPSISPLIQWKHEHDWHVPKYELKHLKRLSVTIVPDNKDWKFLSGHVVDGRNLFPATAYLVVAWDCYLKLNHLLKEETKIVFENVKFQKMTVLSKKKLLVLTVELTHVEDKFEIREGDECLVTGTMRTSTRNFDFTTSRSDSPLTMGCKDIYKKLNLHGYHYKDAFCCLQGASLDGTVGAVNWINWTAFLDALEQFTLITKELDHLYVPSGIGQLFIDPQMHAQTLTRHNHTLPVYFDKSSGTFGAPGVEFRDLLVSKIKKRSEKPPMLESYQFVPLASELSLVDSVTVTVQLVTENLGNAITVIEVVDSFSDDNSQLLCPIIEKALENEFRVKSHLSVYSNKLHKDLKVTYKGIEQLPPDVDLVIVSRASQRPHPIKELLNSQNCFVLSREDPDFEAFAHLEVISVYRTNSELLVLLRNGLAVSKRVVEVHSDLAWLEQLQSQLNDKAGVLLVAQNDSTSGVLGLIKCLQQEVGQSVSCVFLQDSGRKFQAEDDFFKKQLRKNLLVNVLRDGAWGSYRYVPLRVVPRDCFHTFCVTHGGDLSNVKYVQGPLSKDDRIVQVNYAGVNYKDVVVATGRVNSGSQEYRSNLIGLGFEFSATDSRGRRIMGLTPSSAFSNFVSGDEAVTCLVPPEWSLEDAATVPITYLTVLYALVEVCRLRRGQSVLVHSGTGGVGQSTINICLHFNCNIFATVGSEKKRSYLKTLYPTIPESQVGSSRDTTFQQMILKETGGKGVDIIINALSEDKLQASTRCLARRGVFVELGKYDSQMNNPLSADNFSDGRTYVGIHLDKFLEKDPTRLQQLSSLMGIGIREGYVKPLPRVVYQQDKVKEALRYMSLGKHTGKILLKFKDGSADVPKPLQAKPRFFCNSNKVYVIVGGLGGFGIELTDWLIGRGAQKLVLVSRSGPSTGYQKFKLRTWSELGCKVLISQDNLTTEEGCVGLLGKTEALGAVDGIFNLSVVLHDALFENQTKDTFNTPMAPKALITKNLDAVSRELCLDLRQFVVFSSLVCGRGHAGQTNYGMANSVAERICERRKAQGFPALAIQWGIIGDVGLVAEKSIKVKDLDGVLEQKISSCLDVMDTLLMQNEAIVSSSIVDSEKSKRPSTSDDFLSSVIQILAITDVKHVSMHSTLSNLGMDSTTTVQLRQFLETECNIHFTSRELREMTLHTLMLQFYKRCLRLFSSLFRKFRLALV